LTTNWEVMIALMIFFLLQGYCTNIWQSNCQWNNALFDWNPNCYRTSDIDISCRWTPSKDFQVTDMFNSELLCLKKNGILLNFCNDSKQIVGNKFANTPPNVWFEKKTQIMKNSQFFKTLKFSENPSFIFFHFKVPIMWATIDQKIN